jgi:hypothetical protein
VVASPERTSVVPAYETSSRKQWFRRAWRRKTPLVLIVIGLLPLALMTVVWLRSLFDVDTCWLDVSKSRWGVTNGRHFYYGADGAVTVRHTATWGGGSRWFGIDSYDKRAAGEWSGPPWPRRVTLHAWGGIHVDGFRDRTLKKTTTPAGEWSLSISVGSFRPGDYAVTVPFFYLFIITAAFGGATFWIVRRREWSSESAA